jgi:hypothetical protein
MSSTDTEQAIDLAEQAAEAVRALNYLTRRPGTPADPADTYLLLAALTTLAQRLPQLLTQINRQLDTDLDPTQLRVDDWAPIHDPAALIDHVCSDLHCASQHADRLGTALDSAQQAIAHIAVADTHQPNERPEITEQGVSFRPQPEGQFSAAVDRKQNSGPFGDTLAKVSLSADAIRVRARAAFHATGWHYVPLRPSLM